MDHTIITFNYINLYISSEWIDVIEFLSNKAKIVELVFEENFIPEIESYTNFQSVTE